MLPFQRPLMLIGGCVVIGGLFIGWSGLSSYVRTGAGMAGNQIRQMVPTDFKVEQLSTMIEDLDGTIAEQRARLIKQQVDLEYLEQDVLSASERRTHLEQEVRAAQTLLQTERAHYQLGGREIPRQRVVAEAQQRAESLVRARATEDTKAHTLEALREALTQAEAQITAAEGQRATYAMRLNELRAGAQQVAMRKELATSLDDLPGAFNKGAFQQVEASFARIEREIEVQSRLLDRHGRSTTGPELNFGQAEDTDIMAILDRALGEPTSNEATDASPSMALHHPLPVD